MDGILDEKGFVLENQYLVVSFPQWNGILAYKVLARTNKGFEELNYGALPVSFSGHTSGVIPANNRTGSFKISWTRLPTERATDMFWYDDPSKLLHVKLDIKPFMLRKYLYLTEGIQQVRYLGVVTADPSMGDDFGYWRGEKELIILPFMHIAFDVYNKTNMDLRTYLRIKYGEYKVEFIKDADLLFNLMTRKIRAYWFTYPGEIPFPTDPFVRAYNINQPFPLRTEKSQVQTDVGIILAGGTVPK